MLKPLPELVADARRHLRCVDAQTAHTEIHGNDGIIFDVREAVEVAHLTAPRSVNIPRGVLEMKVPEICPDPERPIYLHCASGGRATFAAEQLQRLGYNRVSVITCNVETVKAVQEA
jgi:phage shock protein E